MFNISEYFRDYNDDNVTYTSSSPLNFSITINSATGIVNITANNAPDKLLGDEDVALFQLVRDMAANDQVTYTLILDTDKHYMV